VGNHRPPSSNKPLPCCNGCSAQWLASARPVPMLMRNEAASRRPSGAYEPLLLEALHTHVCCPWQHICTSMPPLAAHAQVCHAVQCTRTSMPPSAVYARKHAAVSSIRTQACRPHQHMHTCQKSLGSFRYLMFTSSPLRLYGKAMACVFRLLSWTIPTPNLSSVDSEILRFSKKRFICAVARRQVGRGWGLLEDRPWPCTNAPLSNRATIKAAPETPETSSV